ncbi:hypothetical protein HN832_04960 [archaeon]|jgi:hypothetical protein|nr:hypothetical protein [archaeon]MBT4374038.1 hypothetical protein [archaeon]MBT4532134.1 hypothetical protein [archaeon]MBT7002024.1 hypothetical protein [archaeon]MBT7282735.1 hypothetical protein [archaeon]
MQSSNERGDGDFAGDYENSLDVGNSNDSAVEVDYDILAPFLSRMFEYCGIDLEKFAVGQEDKAKLRKLDRLAFRFYNYHVRHIGGKE